MHGSGEEAADARARKLAALAATVAPQVEADPARVLQHIQGSMPMTLDEMRNIKARELGIWEKQSSAVGLAKSALTRIEGNV